MCVLHKIGPDDPWITEDETKSFYWIVHWYEQGNYDGSGEAVGLNKDDGLLYFKNLSHCSCYGPMDGWPGDATKYSVEDFLAEQDDIMVEDPRYELKKKVRELIGPTSGG